MATVPYGFCFQPTDQQIISSFLYKRAVKHEPLAAPYNEYVHEEDLFGFKEPWEIWEDYGGDQHFNQDLYFFCELKRLNLTGSLIHRKIGGGIWREVDNFTLVYNENGNPNPIGRKRKFRYEIPGSKEQAGWVLDEYSLLLSADASQDRCNFPFVICRLRKNNRSGGKKRNN